MIASDVWLSEHKKNIALGNPILDQGLWLRVTAYSALPPRRADDSVTYEVKFDKVTVLSEYRILYVAASMQQLLSG